MKFLYFYLRNIIKYGLCSEHVVYQSKSDMFFILKFDHIKLGYFMDFNGEGYCVKTIHTPELVKKIESGINVEYIGKL